MTTVTIDTHGCKLNQADSLALAKHFVDAGYDIVPSNEIADVYVLNSCTVTHVADSKARNAIRVARKLNPNSVIVATGCYAERIGQEIGDLVDVDLVVGNVGKQSLVNKVTDLLGQSMNTFGLNNVTRANKYLTDNYKGTISSRTRAMIKIQEGCNQICAYCIVPKVRGREMSISPQSIVNNILELEKNAYSEVVLTGTQLGTYGFDLQDIDLYTLMTYILEHTNIPRIRISSLQPQEITPKLLSIWDNKRMCPHFHIPLQSGSNKVLKAMRRRYTAEEFRNT
ncbi:MAG: MiaB/RimO family radical SAM methylthiotransferase, partial [Anaerolineales bacterium]|nr:MiaB/RimO family radical SAM methylthiotransferase [Anaerolineales bacterium]